jgi:hypothetical protein
MLHFLDFDQIDDNHLFVKSKDEGKRIDDPYLDDLTSTDLLDFEIVTENVIDDDHTPDGTEDDLVDVHAHC